MKPKLNVLVSYSEGDFIIRPMAESDVTAYASAMGDNPAQRKFLREEMLKSLRHIKEHEEDSNYIFAVLYDGYFYGIIKTIARSVDGTKANAFFYLPMGQKFQESNGQVVKAFISMCKETHIHDEELHIMSFENNRQTDFVINMASSKN